MTRAKASYSTLRAGRIGRGGGIGRAGQVEAFTGVSFRELGAGMGFAVRRNPGRPRAPRRGPYRNSARIDCGAWLAIDSDWMPSCCCTCSA